MASEPSVLWNMLGPTASWMNVKFSIDGCACTEGGWAVRYGRGRGGDLGGRGEGGCLIRGLGLGRGGLTLRGLGLGRGGLTRRGLGLGEALAGGLSVGLGEGRLRVGWAAGLGAG